MNYAIASLLNFYLCSTYMLEWYVSAASVQQAFILFLGKVRAAFAARFAATPPELLAQWLRVVLPRPNRVGEHQARGMHRGGAARSERAR